MAVDKKSDHVGNHGGGYTDIDGMSRQFSYVDYDRKLPSRTESGRESEEAKAEKAKRLEDLRADIKAYIDRRIEEILVLPAVNAVSTEDNFVDKAIYEDLIIRDIKTKTIFWNEKVLREACHINQDLCRNLFLRVWRHTVSESYWYEDMSHEDMLAGKWKEWQ